MDNEEVTQEPEPIVIGTRGTWQKFEEMTKQEFEIGKTYNIKVQGICEFAISKNKPSSGICTNEITYTKGEENHLWIRTGK